MARITAIEFIQGMSGRLSKNGGYYFSTDKKSGALYVRRCPVRTGAPTEEQLAHRERFAEISALTAKWFAQNKPGRGGDPTLEGTPEYYRMRDDFVRQDKISRFPAYVHSRMAESYAQLGVKEDKDRVRP